MQVPKTLFQNEQGVQLSAVDWLVDHHRAKEQERREMVDALDLRPDDRILDSACGPGFWTRLFAEKVFPTGRVVGLDFSPDLLDYARADFINDPLADVVEFVVGNFHDLPFPPESFDVTFLGNCLCYISDIEEALEKHKKVTRTGGRVISKDFDGAAVIFHPIAPTLTLKVVASAARALEEAPSGAVFDNFVGRKTHGLFLKAGFKNISTRSYAVQKVAPLTPEAKRYIAGNAKWYGQFAAPYLSTGEWQQWVKAFEPESEDYVLDREDFYFCMVETVTIGTV